MKQAFFILIIIVIFSACEMPTYSPGGDLTSPTPAQAPTIETTSFEESPSGDIVFKTNDDTYCMNGGSTIWKIGSVTDSPMTTVTVQMAKISGLFNKGYGVVFCAQDESNFLALMINTEGYFIPVRVVNNNIESLETTWIYTGELTRGYNITNKITVAYSGSNDFVVSINDTKVHTFTLSDAPFYTSGGFGYIVSVGFNEDFPKTPVDVRFRQITPPDIGL